MVGGGGIFALNNYSLNLPYQIYFYHEFVYQKSLIPVLKTYLSVILKSKIWYWMLAIKLSGKQNKFDSYPY